MWEGGRGGDVSEWVGALWREEWSEGKGVPLRIECLNLLVPWRVRVMCCEGERGGLVEGREEVVDDSHARVRVGRRSPTSPPGRTGRNRNQSELVFRTGLRSTLCIQR